MPDCIKHLPVIRRKKSKSESNHKNSVMGINRAGGIIHIMNLINNLRGVKVKAAGPPCQLEITDPQIMTLAKCIGIYLKEHPLVIPKIIHQIWLGENEPPWEWINTFRKRYIEKNPDWTYMFWRKENIGGLPLINRDIYDQEVILSGKTDILCYELLYKYGGVYIAVDMHWLNEKPLQELLDRTNETGFFAGTDDFKMNSNSVIGCAKHNPIMYYVIHLLANTYYENRINAGRPTWISTGTCYFSEAVSRFEITRFDKHYFYPLCEYIKLREIDTSIFRNSYMIKYGYSIYDLDKRSRIDKDLKETRHRGRQREAGAKE